MAFPYSSPVGKTYSYVSFFALKLIKFSEIFAIVLNFSIIKQHTLL